MDSDGGTGGDEVGWWNCSLCTYKNSADKFKCEICLLRRGTSTRKPRCSTDTIVAEVMKQQEQIRQQTKAKSSPKSKAAAPVATTTTAAPVIAATTTTTTTTTTSSSSATMTPEPTTSSPNHSASSLGVKKLQEKQETNPLKNRPIEINGNLIKYTPPTSTGRTGLIIDKNRFTQHSVTVNYVTITFTEFATRQNKYIIKKKKRSRHSEAPQTSATDED